ncbi:Ribonuclease/ribotoxin [Xylariaceae sp. FL0594]|nr:Ribonuclease/ribotoxin [Xylariaceae sp. FL0594]
MFGSKVLPIVLAALTTVSAVAIKSPHQASSARADCAYTCGKVCYTQDDLDAAVDQGYGYYQDDEQVGDNNYPHKYNNYEGFDFPDPGPWYEFPILGSDELYTGGSPGADRVVFDADGRLQEAITHTGASGNDFVACMRHISWMAFEQPNPALYPPPATLHPKRPVTAATSKAVPVVDTNPTVVQEAGAAYNTTSATGSLCTATTLMQQQDPTSIPASAMRTGTTPLSQTQKRSFVTLDVSHDQ